MQPTALSGGQTAVPTVSINGDGPTTTTTTTTTLSFPSTSPTSTVQMRNSLNAVADGSRSGRNSNGVTTSVKAVSSRTVPPEKVTVQVKAVVTVKQTGGLLSSIGIGHEDISDWFGRTFQLHLISSHLHSETGLEKATIKSYAKKAIEENGDIKYEAKFEVPVDFGEIGAVMVENQHNYEMFLKDIILESSLVRNPMNIPCDSWVHPTSQNPRHRIFFTTKSYLPSDTPDGLTRYREEELNALRGDGLGERKKGERIYDYDVYNDLGNPDSSPDLARPVLGGKQNPYPRRIRTGRARTKSDPKTESRSSDFYVPRDEEFSDVKQSSFSYKTLSSVLRAVIPTVETLFIDPDLGFPNFTAIDSLFDQGLNLPPRTADSSWTDILPRLIRTVAESSNDVLQFEVPEAMERDRFFWLKDEQFGRQTLAGVNPCSIELVKEWPLKSKLDPNVYGPPESAITTEIVEKQIKGFMTVDEAMKQKKLFIIDYHDLLLPFVNLVRKVEGTTLYGSRALFFLTPAGTLKPIAIELTRPPMDGKPQWKKAYRESNCSSTEEWLWKLAKAHVLAHDSGYHELVSHWLRTHACTEPYIIATNRQLSAMHPINRLLQPHFRYTMEINSLARQALINADGIIERAFSPLKYSMLLSSAVYDQSWRFDYEALPKDLVRRGMAVEDPSAPHGLKLTIEDYPYASDGLILWDALTQWITDYVNHYYPDPTFISKDSELQSWWTEIRTVGHQDKKDETWWPNLKTPLDLVEILSTIAWVASAQHAAVNFGQYPYGGYFPNRPSIARTNMPDEDPRDEKEWEEKFMVKPESVMLEMFPSQFQASAVMAVLDVLSSHSEDEEYIGQVMEPAWRDDAVVKAAFEKFRGRLEVLESVIDERNGNSKLRNRNGAGVPPYELLKPVSEPGITGKGVPYSISI